MKNRFDELTKSMAQSVTRRTALKKFGVGLAGVVLARFGLNNAQAITGGVLDGNAHPNVGGIVWRLTPRWPDLQPPVVCGSGALIHPRVFITAGHATDPIESYIAQGAMTLEDLRVSFASYAFESDAWQHVSGVLTHPGYANNATSAADVGVLLLRDPVLYCGREHRQQCAEATRMGRPSSTTQSGGSHLPGSLSQRQRPQ